MHVIRETSRGYEQKLVEAIQWGDIAICVVLPLRVQALIRAHGQYAKADPLRRRGPLRCLPRLCGLAQPDLPLRPRPHCATVSASAVTSSNSEPPHARACACSPSPLCPGLPASCFPSTHSPHDSG